ncbi:hypothetical protein [Chitinophaga sp. Ak27]|uniref:glycosyl-4,4'-diaponeurosporenoate acyltransferase CrtO family protein n=1 Tax=Chitinophaga sp. Ak27 TaxID=2726116 RepID=UPI00145E3533|nr:hypothetical protein [Chitinophaga sp. Ak27]NLU92356.1 hypothetical protein [Chitinophaga sp. Ak27]
MRKALNLISISIIGLASLYALVYYMKLDSLTFAWALNFLLMLCVLAFTETLKSPLTSSYYNEKRWERGGRIYETLGINFYRKLLVWIGWEKLNKKSKPVEKNIKSLMNLLYQTKKSELGHIIILLIVFGLNVFTAFKFGVLKSLWLLGLNIALNLYPIFLQRYNRPRIARAINLGTTGSRHTAPIASQPVSR